MNHRVFQSLQEAFLKECQIRSLDCQQDFHIEPGFLSVMGQPQIESQEAVRLRQMAVVIFAYQKQIPIPGCFPKIKDHHVGWFGQPAQLLCLQRRQLKACRIWGKSFLFVLTVQLYILSRRRDARYSDIFPPPERIQSYRQF